MTNIITYLCVFVFFGILFIGIIRVLDFITDHFVAPLMENGIKYQYHRYHVRFWLMFCGVLAWTSTRFNNTGDRCYNRACDHLVHMTKMVYEEEAWDGSFAEQRRVV